MTEKDFLRCFALLEDKFRKQNEIMKNGWYKSFNIYEVEELEEAIGHHPKKMKDFPEVYGIYEDVGWIVKFKKDDAERAVQEALRILKD